MMPLVIPIELAVFAALLWATSMVSAGSITVAALFPLLVLVFPAYRAEPAFVSFSALVAVLVIWRHHTNIVRIYRGEERRITWGRHARRDAAPAPAKDDSEG
jgi:glycerol-3-phosphate acyltransferase PlsY